MNPNQFIRERSEKTLEDLARLLARGRWPQMRYTLKATVQLRVLQA